MGERHIGQPLQKNIFYTISGYIKDKQTGEALVGANVFVKQLMKGTTTNVYGFYSLTLENGEYEIAYIYLGYKDQKIKFNLQTNVKQNIELEAESIEVGEVVIKGERNSSNTESTDMGKIDISVESIRNLPVIFGEQDILKTIQLLPGVMSSGEGNSGFYVRGGGPDQNLILLDEAVVYNPGHLMGFFSVFNSDAINNTTLIKGGIPANYGGRLSSVLDISLKEGNTNKITGEGGIGIISSRLTLQGPIKKEKSSFIVSGRRTYIDFLLQPFLKGTRSEGSGYFFYDLNTKINYTFSEKNRIFLSGYFGRDIFSFSGGRIRNFKTFIPWGNATATFRWNHLFNDKLFMNASAIFNDYNFKIETGVENWNFSLSSGIRDANLKIDFDYFPRLRSKIKFGTNYTYHIFTPNSSTFKSGETEFKTDNIINKYAHEGAVYAMHEYDLNESFRINYGLRFTGFQQVGPYYQFLYDENEFVTDTVHYFKSLENVKTYSGLEPRFSLRFMLNKNNSLKTSFTRNFQYIHMVSNSSQTLPTDLWIPSSLKVNPQKSDQYATGYFLNFLEDKYESSIEIYYKTMNNQIEFKDSYRPELNRDTELDFVFGEGTAYGIELFVKKRTGKFNGWIGYTLSKSLRHFEDLKTTDFPTRYDRTHDGSVVLSYQISKRWSASATFVYGTGSSITLPLETYFIEGYPTNEYGPRNSNRMEDYHRLDVALTLYGKENKKFKSNWNFSVYNVYNRHNPYFYYIDTEGEPKTDAYKVTGYKVYLFPILPSVTWNFKF
ncbi:MAG: TonB-dependent receptor [Bacteroidetes bacterium RIFCSPLOWO2_02_FULL_36_8]|nr:MAG: TonB-dependent receptor [Bacteroidetes bacterium RIFCSPLOWO2_02_FULL_36_8]OFY71604.1 MAG: TonB-dependent receptor [Bacteroidetes bacterium RIFCSPLOWO2_12_FULL_37_12]